MAGCRDGDAHGAPSVSRVGARRRDPLAVGQAGQHLDRARAADADLDLAPRARTRRRSTKTALPCSGVGRDQQRIRLSRG